LENHRLATRAADKRDGSPRFAGDLFAIAMNARRMSGLAIRTSGPTVRRLAFVWLAWFALSACSAARGGEANDAGTTRDDTEAPSTGSEGASKPGDKDAASQQGPRARRDGATQDQLDAADTVAPRPDRDQDDAATPTADAATAISNGDDAGANPAASTDAESPVFVLTPVDFPMSGDELAFPDSAYPPTNASPAFQWSGVPAGSKSLALVFRDLGNGAVKWILWNISPTLTSVPPNLSKVAMPPEVPGSRQLGSLDNQGYAGPGSGARQYDFTLHALDVAELPSTARLTTAQIYDDVMPDHELATTAPVLVRNTRNLP
jgi:Raf kinase inhibitor-like YbhB/YbcL family protein